MTIKIRGKKDVLRNLNRAIGKIEGNLSKGLLAAGQFIEGESNEIVPHDKGVLIGSSFAVIRKRAGRVVARIGYKAGYAAFVHEMPTTNKFTKPGTGPKFLWKAATMHSKQILQIIRSRAKF